MEKKGKDLIFASLILRDGSGTIPVGTEWTTNSNHPRTDDISYMDDDLFTLNTLSISHKTYIASGFNSWVLMLKPNK